MVLTKKRAAPPKRVGENAREEVLKKNYSVAQTIFIKIPILLIRNNSNNETISIDIHLNRSHAKYVYELLIDGCKILNI